MKKNLIMLFAVSLLAVGIFANGSSEKEGDSSGSNVMFLYHWWSAGGEKDAVNAILSDFKDKNPGIAVVENPVAGGGGTVMQAQIKAMIMAGESPDTFQVTLGDGQLKQWVNVLEPIDDIWTGLDIPPVLKGMVSSDGHQYGVPINVHTSNILWFNTKLVKQLSIKMPINSLEELYAACDKAKEAGITPLALGVGSGQKLWWVHLQEAILPLIPGVDSNFITDLYTGKVDPTDSRVRKVMEVFHHMLTSGYFNDDYPSLTWDQAGNLIMNDQALFFPMGDWAKGMFVAAGWRPLEDFNFQLLGGIQAVHSDQFVMAKNAPHKESVKAWLSYLSTKEAETLFNPIKGSIPPRMDASAEPYDVISLGLLKLFRDPNTTVIQDSDVATPVGYMETFGDMFSVYATNPDVNKGTQEYIKAYNKVFKK